MKKLIIVFSVLCFQFGFAQVTDTGDKVGIGTSSPLEKLHVNGNIYTNMGEGFKIFGDANYFGQWLDGIVFQMEDGNAANGSTDGGFVFRGYTRTDNIYTDWMVIKTGGKVGIGTNTPDEKLSVNGNIHAKEVRVDLTGWSDFVFEEDYKLPTLEEVEKHIKEKGHLQNIPSAKEVAENGILLGEMDAKLLQKIEELTLYTIEQQKEINSLKSDNTELLKQNETLKLLLADVELLKNELKNLKQN